MTRGLRRFHQSGQSHFITVSCDHREAKFVSAWMCDLFLVRLEATRKKFAIYIYGYVVMPEHVHLLVSEPRVGLLADAMHWLKLGFTRRLKTLSAIRVPAPRPVSGSFWEKRCHDRNVRDAAEFTTKLDYIHRNPVKRGLVQEPELWKWSSYRHYALREVGPVEIESEWTARERERKNKGAE
jgi:putative transposase